MKVEILDVFISHSSQDVGLASQLIDLLRAALNLRAGAILCTSVDGYRLPAGANSDEQLRIKVFEARTFVGILSPASLSSTYVLFELGARWGAKKSLAPLLAPGLTAKALEGPLAGLNALSCESASQLHQLVQELAAVLGIEPEGPHAYQSKVDALMYTGTPTSEALQSPPSPVDPVVASHPKVQSKAQSDPKTEYANSDAIIRHHCEKEWPDDFSMRAYCIGEQRTAVAKLSEGGPKDVPEPVFTGIRAKCAAEWPDNYAMRVYCESRQIEGYRKVAGLK